MDTLKFHLDSYKLQSCISSTSCVGEAVKTMKKNNDSFVLVQDNGRYVGIFTESDLKNRVVAKKLSPDTTALSEVMTNNVVFFDINDSIEDCLDKLENHDFRHLPIIRKGKVITVLSARHLFKIALSQLTQEREHLMEYIAG